MKIRSGSILILTLLITTALFFLGIVFLQLYRSEQGIAKKQKFILVAQEAAYAGIEDALYQLKLNSNWNAGFNNVELSHSKATYSLSFNSGQTAIPYSTNNASGSSAVTGYGGTVVPAGSIFLVSLGRCAATAHIEKALVRVAGTALFTKAAFASDFINMSGQTNIDSYNSKTGAYAVSKLATGGDIGTNSTTAGAVKLGGGVTVAGTVTVGPGGTGSVVQTSGGATYISPVVTASALTSFFYPSPPSLASMAAVNVSSGTVNLVPGVYPSITASGGIINLAPGDYVLNGSLSLSGGTQVFVPSGTVTLYAQNGSITLNDAAINSPRNPDSLTLYGSQNISVIQINGKSTVTMGIYAPAADVSIKNSSELFGALTSKSLTITSTAKTAIHFDQNLKTLTTAVAGLTMLSRW